MTAQAARKLRIVLHDYSGHIPQVMMSRALARRGHEVLHLYSSDFETPRAGLAKTASDPDTFHIDSVPVTGPYQKRRYLIRQIQEWLYGFALTHKTLAFKPDMVICSNTQPVPLLRLQNACLSKNIPFVFWVMDIYSVAIASAFGKLPVLGRPLVAFFDWLEGWELRRSDSVVLITEGFSDIVRKWKVDPARAAVMPLWSDLDEISPTPKDNDWSRQHGLSQTTNLVYGGTLGLKHNPELLVGLAQAMVSRPDVRVIVLSEGMGANYLKKRKQELNLGNLLLLPYELFARLPQVIGAADVMLVLLEASAASICAPGKVPTHLCAGKAQVAAVPRQNQAWEVINGSGGGLTCEAGDQDAFIARVTELMDDPELRAQMGRNAREYAEREFDIDRLAVEFEGYIYLAMQRRQSSKD